jgi:hypothetical protein
MVGVLFVPRRLSAHWSLQFIADVDQYAWNAAIYGADVNASVSGTEEKCCRSIN